MTEQVDVTPSWEGIVPALWAVLENPGAPRESHATIERELMKMARLADKYVEIAKSHPPQARRFVAQIDVLYLARGIVEWDAKHGDLPDQLVSVAKQILEI